MLKRSSLQNAKAHKTIHIISIENCLKQLQVFELMKLSKWRLRSTILFSLSLSLSLYSFARLKFSYFILFLAQFSLTLIYGIFHSFQYVSLRYFLLYFMNFFLRLNNLLYQLYLLIPNAARFSISLENKTENDIDCPIRALNIDSCRVISNVESKMWVVHSKSPTTLFAYTDWCNCILYN